MTEFELAYLYVEMSNAILTVWSAFFATTVSFVVAGYLAAHRLTRPMLVISVLLYVLAVASTTFFAQRLSANFAGLLQEMHSFAVAKRGLLWTVAAQSDPGLSSFLPSVSVLLMPFASIAAVFFFFYSRSANRKAEAGGWQPKVKG